MLIYLMLIMRTDIPKIKKILFVMLTAFKQKFVWVGME